MKKILCLLLSTTMIALCLTGLAYAEQRDQDASINQATFQNMLAEVKEELEALVFPPKMPEGMVMLPSDQPLNSHFSTDYTANEWYSHIDGLNLPDTFPETLIDAQSLYVPIKGYLNTGGMLDTALVSSLEELNYYYARLNQQNSDLFTEKQSWKSQELLKIYQQLLEIDFSQKAVLFLNSSAEGRGGIRQGRLATVGNCLIVERVYSENDLDKVVRFTEILLVDKADLPATGDDLELYFYTNCTENDPTDFDKYRLMTPMNYFYFAPEGSEGQNRAEAVLPAPEELYARRELYENIPLAPFRVVSDTQYLNAEPLTLSATIFDQTLQYEVLSAWGDNQYRHSFASFNSASVVITNKDEATSMFLLEKNASSIRGATQIELYERFINVNYEQKAIVIVHIPVNDESHNTDTQLVGISIQDNNLVFNLQRGEYKGNNRLGNATNMYCVLVDKADLPNNGEGLNLYYHIADEANEIAQSETVTATMCSFPATFREWIPGRDFTVTYEEYRRDMIENYWENRSEIDFPYGGIQGDSQIDTPWN